MFETLASPAGFLSLMLFFGFGALGAVIVKRNDQLANFWSNGCAIVGGLFGVLFGSSVLATNHQVSMKLAVSAFPALSLSIHIDALSAFFIFVISLVTIFCSIYGVGYVKEYYKRYSIGTLGFFYNAFIAGMLLVVSASNGIFFLIAWEVMSLASYFLVVYDRQDPKNVRAGYVYLIMTHIGAACLLLAFLLLFNYTHSFDFDVIRAHVHLVPQLYLGVVFILALIGLGIKAGIIPLHIWLPSAHPAAPSYVSALMSGVMIKTGIYMMIRLFIDMLQPVPLWWGLTVLIIGAVSSFLGVLYALTEHDIKRLLAYHSIENIGIILLGLGSALTFSALHQPGLVLIALAAALFHTLNHATFKSLLFLGAGSVIQATHTRNFEKYGGLIKYMPITALFFLVGAMAIAGLPPFNGFFSEWLTFQALFRGLIEHGSYVKWIFLFGAGSLAITGGLALACFVKAFGITFLARPRSEAAEKARETSPFMSIGMACIGAICLLIGLFSAPIIAMLESIARQTTTLASTASLMRSSSWQITVGQGYAVSGPVVALLLLIAGVGIWFLVRYGVYKQQRVTVGHTWDCGTPLTPRMEITATGFARSIILVFRGLLKPTLQHTMEYDDAASRYMPRSRTVSLHVRDVYDSYFYAPLYKALIVVSARVKSIQNGNLNAYVLYIFVTLVVTLLAVGVWK